MSKHQKPPIEIQTLFKARENVAPDRDGQVVPVQGVIVRNAFFPGSSGLWMTPTDKERRVLPPTLQGCDSFLENPDSPLVMPVGKVMVLGNDFCQKSWHETCLHQDDYDLNTPTWKYLLPLLKDAGIPPRHCFFTNAYMGLRLAEDGMGPSPGADDLDFVARCRSFLFKQIEVQKPRLILALGKHSIQLIAGLSPDLTAWEGCKTFPQLDESGPVIGGVHFNGDMEHPVTVVALVHPSMRPCNVGHRRYCGLTGKAAELAMLKDALNLSGLQRL